MEANKTEVMDESHCAHCNKKLSFVDSTMGKCKCGKNYCKKHRDVSTHTCSFDFHKDFKEKLEKNLQAVQAKKVITI